ncbi:MAG: hypothetical protein JXB25_05705 [Deltaproteobacteria bacterium]|nr:hypothetical protein [Deltaproteobacteria bacterium]
MEKLENLTSVFETAAEKIEEEVGLLIDAQLHLTLLETNLISKKECCSRFAKKSVMTRFSVSGDNKGECYLFTDIKDAILFAGALVMLPATELEQRISKEVFGTEENDAFGEIANIIAGALTQSFGDQYEGALRFSKAGLETLAKNKIDIPSDQPFPDQQMFMASFSVEKDGKKLSSLFIILPTPLLGIESAEAAPKPEEKKAPAQKTSAAGKAAAGPEVRGPDEAPTAPPPEAKGEGPEAPESALPAAAADEEEVILLLSDAQEEAQVFAESLESRGHRCVLKGFKEEFKEIFQARLVRGIFLIMKEVDDQGFAAAIKVKSAASNPVPLIAAGPKWTRAHVLQAVKYGSCDILVTPASTAEIQEKAEKHMFRKAS